MITRPAGSTAAMIVAAALAIPLPSALAEPDLEAGKTVYRDANCIGCHKWHGGGGGGYGGAALSLRETGLDREFLIEVLSLIHI